MSTVEDERELIVPHIQGAGQATAIRSTVLQSSLATLRERGHFEEWSKRVDAQSRAMIVEAIAPSWIPIEVAEAHYAACEELNLPPAEQTAIGAMVGDRFQGTFLATLMKSARAAGMTPWILLSQFDRFMARVFQGGSAQLTRTGPKDVDIELRGVGLCTFGYFRTGFAGVVRAGILISGVRTTYVKSVRFKAAPSTYLMHASWV